jgi:drug/metabolite transporter (DMT)-like permease
MQPSKSNALATLLGYAGLLLWAIAALLVAKLKNIPTFEILSIALAISFLVIVCKLTILRQWQRIKQPILLWIIGVIGIYGNAVTYMAAFKFAPPAHVDLINYLWPIFVIIGCSFLPKEKFTAKHLIAGLFGLSGVYLVITNNAGLVGFHTHFLTGYGLALLDAVIWSGYTLLSRYYGQTPIEMIGMYCGIGALLSLMLHFQFETTVIPSLSQLLTIIGIGSITSGLAYFLWDYGVKHGNFKLLSVLSYGNPIISVLLLVVFHEAKYSHTLVLACFLVAGGALIGSIKWQTVLKRIIARSNVLYSMYQNFRFSRLC